MIEVAEAHSSELAPSEMKNSLAGAEPFHPAIERPISKLDQL
jgi:hypothetical protein